MKKLILAVLTAALMSIGLVGVSATSAQASCTPSRYGACTPTSVSVTVVRGANGKPTALNVEVTSTGTVKPTGTVRLTVSNPRKFRGKGKKARPAKLGTTVVTYPGQVVTTGIPVSTNRPGTYTIIAEYFSPNNSIFSNSVSTTTFTVEKAAKKKKRNR